MQQFRDLFAVADVAILSKLGEDGTLDNNPVRGELSTAVQQGGLSGSVTGLQGEVFRLPDSQVKNAVRGSVFVLTDSVYMFFEDSYETWGMATGIWNDAIGGTWYDVVDVVPEGTGITGLSLRLRL